ncbi:uncharacterized protein VNE69_05185 [Vairimorpha necatrix]|uniref:Variable surface protein n=1 Tax=Vairimorpha necatrix TaxID=6039 RepID=A0AAX4JCC2_9MICR
MKFLLFFTNISIIMFGIINTSDNVETVLKEIINNDEICEELDYRIVTYKLSECHVRVFTKLIWDTITNHDIFQKMIQDDTSKNSFTRRSSQLYDGYLETLSLKKWDNKLMRSLSRKEKTFIDKIILGIFEYHDMLRLCYKDIINSSTSVIKTIEGIINLHTCFVPIDISVNLPSPVYKMCRGLIPHFKACYGKNGTQYLQEESFKIHEQLINAKCSPEKHFSRMPAVTPDYNSIIDNIPYYNNISPETTPKYVSVLDNLSEFYDTVPDCKNRYKYPSTDSGFIYDNYSDYIDINEDIKYDRLVGRENGFSVVVLFVCCLIIVFVSVILGYMCYRKSLNQARRNMMNV